MSCQTQIKDLWHGTAHKSTIKFLCLTTRWRISGAGATKRPRQKRLPKTATSGRLQSNRVRLLCTKMERGGGDNLVRNGTLLQNGDATTTIARGSVSDRFALYVSINIRFDLNITFCVFFFFVLFRPSETSSCVLMLELHFWESPICCGPNNSECCEKDRKCDWCQTPG